MQAAGHCNFARTEWERGFELLRDWVEAGDRPQGEDMLAANLTRLGETFTEVPRLGSPLDDKVRGAEKRVTIRGSATIDGTPMHGGTLWFEVFSDGFWQACSFQGVPPARGEYERVVAADDEVAGCGKAGAPIIALTVKDGAVLASTSNPWPEQDRALVDIAFQTGPAQPAPAALTRVFGAVLDADGTRLPPGTMIEAYVGETRCARAFIAPVRMQFGGPDEFTLIVAGPTVREGCLAGGELRFAVNGKSVEGELANLLDGQGHELVLITR